MEILTFPHLVEGIFIKRPNRFLARVEVEGSEALAHVHDPGRLSELLVPGTRLLLLPRKGERTDYHVIAAWGEGYGWVFIHSGYHRRIVERLMEYRALPEFAGLVGYAPEVRINSHRVDFGLVFPDQTVLVEVKGCTLFRGKYALFPDAPTKRGREHVEILARKQPSMILFLVMTDKVDYFVPNWETDPKFSEALLNALESGVHATALTLSFDGRTLRHAGRIPVLTGPEAERTARLGLKAAQRYNERFGPESRATLTAASEDSAWVLFHGFACVSCGLSDYFEDFAEISDMRMANARRIGTVHLVRYTL